MAHEGLLKTEFCHRDLLFTDGENFTSYGQHISMGSGDSCLLNQKATSFTFINKNLRNYNQSELSAVTSILGICNMIFFKVVTCTGMII